MRDWAVLIELSAVLIYFTLFLALIIYFFG